MANRRIEGGKDTLTRLEETWQAVLQEDSFPTVTAFAARARIGYYTLCHRYKDWADKVRRRRDRRFGKRKRSPVTQAKPRTEDMSQALDQIKELQKLVAKQRKELDDLTVERDRLALRAGEVAKLEAENRKWRGIADNLMDQLQMAGLPQSRLVTLWGAIQKQMRVIGSDRGGEPASE